MNTGDTAAELEFRVLTGQQAGARAPLPGLQGACTIASHGDHELVVRDMALDKPCAHVSWRVDGWTFAGVQGNGERSLLLGELVHAGGVWITVDRSGAPWPPVAPQAGAGDSAPAVGSPDSAAAATGSTGQAQPGIPGTAPALVPPAQSGGRLAAVMHRLAPSWRTRRGRTMLGVGLTALLATAAVAANFASSPARDGAEVADTVPDMATVERTLAAHGLSSRIHVTQREDGRLSISGVVRDEGELDTLRRVVGPLGPQFALYSVLTQSDLATQVESAAANLEPGLKLEAKPVGVVRLGGVARDSARLAASVRRLRQDIGSYVQLEIDALTPDQVAEQFAADLQGAGIEAMTVAWDGSLIRMKGNVPASHIRQLETMLIAFDKRFGLPFNAQLDDATPESSRRTPAISPALARSVVAVVGGPVPYVLLADGTRLGPGSMVAGHRIDAIRADAVIFESQAGTVRLKR